MKSIFDEQVHGIYYEIWKKSRKTLFKYIKENTYIDSYKKYSNHEQSESEIIGKTIQDYHEYIEKSCVGIKCTVQYSRELNLKIRKGFISEDELKAVRSIQMDLERGLGIEKYLSSKARKGEIDLLFNDWDILHCHLSTKENKRHKNLVRRTKNILLIRLHGNEVFFIDIVPHGIGYGDIWYERDILEIVYRNWKYLIREVNSEYIHEANYNMEFIKEARNNNQVYFFDIMPYNKRIIICPGGLASSGHASRFVRKSDDIYRQIKYILTEIFKLHTQYITYPFFIDTNYRFKNLCVQLSMEHIKITIVICLVNLKYFCIFSNHKQSKTPIVFN